MGKGTYRGTGTLLNRGSQWFTREVELSDPIERRKLPLRQVAAEDAERAEERRLEIRAAQEQDTCRKVSRAKIRSLELDQKFAEIARGLTASDVKD